MKVLITAARVRSIVSDSRTFRDIADTLRRHRIRYTYSTEAGYMHIRVPFRSGCLRIYCTASRSAPPVVVSVPGSVPVSVPVPVPVLHADD